MSLKVSIVLYWCHHNSESFYEDICSFCYTKHKYLIWWLWFASDQDGHQGALTCLACNKDGTLVLTGSVDSHAKLINTATGKVGVTNSASESAVNMKSSSVSLFLFVLVKVIGSFSLNGDKDEEASNSVESVGFCKTWVWKNSFSVWKPSPCPCHFR